MHVRSMWQYDWYTASLIPHLQFTVVFVVIHLEQPYLLHNAIYLYSTPSYDIIGHHVFHTHKIRRNGGGLTNERDKETFGHFEQAHKTQIHVYLEYFFVFTIGKPVRRKE